MVNIGTILTTIDGSSEDLTFVRPTLDTTTATDLKNNVLTDITLVEGFKETLSHGTSTLSAFMAGKHTIVVGGPFYSTSARDFHDVVIPDNVSSSDANILDIKFCGPGGKNQSYAASYTGFDPATAPQIYIQYNTNEVLYTQSYSGGFTTNYGLILYYTTGGKHAIYVAGINGPMTKACEFVLENPSNFFTGVDGAAFLVTSIYSGQTSFVPTLSNTTISLFEAPLFEKGAVFNSQGTGATIRGPLDLIVSGNYAYISDQNGSAIEILDISNPSSPVHAGKVLHGQNHANLTFCYSIAKSGNYLYVIDGFGPLEIINVSNPANPVHAATFTAFPGNNYPGGKGLAISGNYAYVTGGGGNYNGIEVINISNPLNPTHAVQILDGSGGASLLSAWGIAISGNYAFVCDTSNNLLEVLNISTPTSPTHVTTLSGFNAPSVIKISGTVAYVLTFNTDNSLTTVDITTPTAPTILDSIANGEGGAIITGASAISISGNYLHLANAGDNSISIFDISNPASIVYVSNFANGTGGAVISAPYTIAASANYSYIASNGAFEIVNVTIPASPTHQGKLLSSSTISEINNPSGIGVSGNYLYVVANGDDAFNVFDITNKSNTAFVTKVKHNVSGMIMDNPSAMDIQGNYAYVMASSDTEGNLVVLDISTPSTPTLAATLANGAGGFSAFGSVAIKVSGNYCYTTDTAPGNTFNIVNISTPTSPVLAGKLVHGSGGALLQDPWGFAISGNYAYIASFSSNALEIINISNPASPTHTGSLVHGTGGAVLTQAQFVAVSGNYAYISVYSENTIEIVNISNPAAPSHVTAFVHGTGGANILGPQKLNVVGNYLIVTVLQGKAIEVLNITNPAAPVHFATLAYPNAFLDSPGATIISGNYLYNGNQTTVEIIDIADLI